MKASKLHRAWVIMAGCCVLYGTLFLVASTGMSLFVSSICSELNLQRAQFNLFFTGEGIAYLFSSSFAGKLTDKFGVRKMLLVVAAVTGSSMLAVSTILSQPWQFCIAGFLCGFGVYFPLVIAPIVLNNWFKKSYATALGISSAFSGLIGALLSPVITSVILSSGWRPAMRIVLIAMEIIAVPAIIFIIRYKPADVGLLPYGIGDVDLSNTGTVIEETGMTLAEAKKNGCFYLLFINSFLLQYQVVLNTQAPSMMTDNGVPGLLMSTVVSVQMISLAVGKVTLGIIKDKTGSAFVTTVVCEVAGCIGAILYLVSFLTGINSILYAAGIFTGYGWACVSILPSAAIQASCGKKHFSTIYGPVLVGSSIMALINSLIVGKLYDITGTHTLALCFIAGVSILSIIAVGMSIKLGKKGLKES